MRLLIIDPHGDSLDFALRCQRDGHDVRHFIRKSDRTESIGKGLVQVVDDHRSWLRWADLVFMADNTLYLQDLDRYRGEGGKVIGASKDSAQWEINRSTGMEVMKKAGIAVPDYKAFKSYDDAIAYVKREDRRFVSKVLDGGELDKALSYCAKSPEDMVYMLQRWKRMQKLSGAFMLQEFIPGIEMAVGAWFGPGGFSAGWCENFEFKKFMNDDMGVATGEQGTVLRFVRASKLARRVLQPLAGVLGKIGYCGYIDVNCIIDERGQPHPLEFTMRPGWPTLNIQMALHEGDHAEWLMNLYNGKDERNWRMNEIATGVVVSIPDYPYSHATKKEVVGVPIYGIDEHWSHVHLCQAMMGTAPKKVVNKIIDCPMVVTAGDYVLVMTGIGTDVKSATDLTYRRLETLSLPNSPMYRTDIGRRLKKQLPKLHALGYASGMEFSTPPLSLSA